MKRRSLTAASVLALIALPVEAPAGEITFEYGGQAHLSTYFLDQDDLLTNEVDNFAAAAEGRIWGRARTITDNGIEYGVRAQLRFQSEEAKFSNDFIRGAPEWVDEVWAYAQTAFGRVVVGMDDGAADNAGIFSPTVSDLNRSDDARHYPVQDPTQGSFTAFTPNGAHPRTDLNGSGDALKVSYYSPRIIGIQLSGSYTPELTRGFNDLFDGGDRLDQQSNIWEVAVNYQASLSGFDIGFYSGFVSGTNERPSANHTVDVIAAPLSNGAPLPFQSIPFTPDDLQEWGAGAQIAYEGFRVGGSYRKTNIAGAGGLADEELFPSFSTGCSVVAGCVLPDSNTTVWGAGITYETGPWRFGVDYVNLEEELPAFIDNTTLQNVRRELTQDAKGWTGAVGYELDENVQFVVGYQRYDFDGPTGGCVTGACDTLQADLAFFQTSMRF